MKHFVKYAYIIISICLITYVLLPSFNFPDAPPNSLQSQEPADTEYIYRRAYFTNLTRGEVLDYYASQFNISFFGFTIPAYRLNYPPEEAQSIIRDQTRSTFLEEVVHPFRESFFINGFEPKNEKDAIFIDNRTWRQKITVKYVPSSLILRTIPILVVILAIPFLYKNWINALIDIKDSFVKLYAKK